MANEEQLGPPQFLFLDLETTGLSPSADQIIEIAAVTTGPDFVPIKRFSRLVVPTTYGGWSPAAYEMHTASGLIDLLKDGSPIRKVGEDFRKFLCENVAEKANLAGNSVHFDRAFLNVHMPVGAMDRLTHRHLDVSALRLLGLAQGFLKMERMVAHRAMEDIEGSLAELRYWMDAFYIGKV